ncbi:hypothetical protein [Bradyrhizobium sp. Leo170]|uniref:hypothetical protein n=1 Tax=Bradyrhizobium sp. Leo170 TaxID=1571199 RepID=UPI00102E278A|nr:hypothetical protein [Bradyrhizobium sp. Leo170]
MPFRANARIDHSASAAAKQYSSREEALAQTRVNINHTSIFVCALRATGCRRATQWNVRAERKLASLIPARYRTRRATTRMQGDCSSIGSTVTKQLACYFFQQCEDFFGTRPERSTNFRTSRGSA